VLFPVCLKVSLNTDYCWKDFNVKQHMEPTPTGASSSRTGLQFVSVSIMSTAF